MQVVVPLVFSEPRVDRQVGERRGPDYFPVACRPHDAVVLGTAVNRSDARGGRDVQLGYGYIRAVFYARGDTKRIALKRKGKSQPDIKSSVARYQLFVCKGKRIIPDQHPAVLFLCKHRALGPLPLSPNQLPGASRRKDIFVSGIFVIKRAVSAALVERVGNVGVFKQVFHCSSVTLHNPAFLLYTAAPELSIHNIDMR